MSKRYGGIIMKKIIGFGITVVFVLQSLGGILWAKGQGPLDVYVIKVKPKGSWTEVTIAIENDGKTDANIQCCTVYLETDAGYAVASLTQDEVRTQNYNKARTPAIIGGIIGAGLGFGGAISGKKELGYAALGTLGTSAIAGTVGQHVYDKNNRNFIIDDVMRNRELPSGLKVAGIAYFPPKKKWPGSQRAIAIHLTYKLNGRSYRTTTPISM